MHLALIDWIIIVSYFVFSLAIGIWFSKRATKSMTDYFISGRQLTWWMAGTSMVATTFASDTPLAVTGLTVGKGVAGNWFWWAFGFGGMVTVFLFARLWRRAEIVTDFELIELRYSGKPAAFLRGFRAIYLTFVLQPIAMGWVTVAMLNVLKHTVFSGIAPSEKTDMTIIAVLLGTTAIYSVISGLWGVVFTDIFQFWLAMAGCITLAVLGVHHVGGIEALQTKVAANYPGGEQAFRFIPDFSAAQPWMPLQIFLILLFFQWWASSYEDPSGGGYVVQRMASCKDEKHALLATLWFRIAHYCLRPWPWIMVAFTAMAMYPNLRTLTDPGVGYPMVIRDIAPVGVRGLMLVTFLAAFMSTLSTQINLGASYLINDVYRRFMRKNASERHYAHASEVASILVLVVGGVATYIMRKTSIESAWRILAAIGAGGGTVYMLRWFWWRVNAWSEISAMVGSLVVFVAIRNLVTTSEYQMLIIAGCTVATWLLVTYLTPPESMATLERFYRKIRPGGPGWKPVARVAPDVAADRNLGTSIVLVFVSSGIIYLVLPAVGYVIFGHYTKALLCFAGAAVCVWLTVVLMNRAGWKSLVQ